jgi:quercetin dioxygenase-like cupin family protein
MRRRICAVKGELIRLGDTTVRFLVEGADSGRSVAVFEVGISARGKMPAPHSHDSFEETIYGLEGVSTWTRPSRWLRVRRCAYRAARSIISITEAT